MAFRSEHVTMNDVARAAGVSKSAVSKALNNKSDISQEVRQKIFDTCETLGYQVNFRIQDLIRERTTGITRNIAFVLVGKEFADPAYARAVDGIAQGAKNFDLHLLLETLSGTENSVYDLPPVLRDSRIDGIVITGELNENIILIIRKLEIPYVILGNYLSIAGDSTTIEIDTEKEIELLVRKLKEKGKKRIAYFGENLQNPNEQRNLESFESALKSNSLEFHNDLIYKGTGSFSGAFAAMEPVFRQPELPFDSIVCLDFRTAQEISVLAKARWGLNKKPDIIIGLGRPFSYYRLPVPCIYIEGYMDKLANQGVNVLWAMISGERTDKPEKIILDIEPEITEDL